MDWEVILSRESSSIVDTWQEYLCVRQAPNGTGWEIAICQHNILGEPPSEWFDDEGNPLPDHQDESGGLKLPLEWNGKPVSHYDGEYIVGDLIVMGEGYVAHADALDPENIKRALVELDWNIGNADREIEDSDQTPVEETPGYVGYIFDNYIDFSDGLKPLEGFNFTLYGEMADALDALERRLEIDFGTGISTVSFDAYSVHEIVGSIPSVDAIYDCPPDQGPAGGSGYIFTLASGCALEDLTLFAQKMRDALDADFSALDIKFKQI
jgi:hypothetical protein